MDVTQQIFPLILHDDLSELTRLLEESPGSIHARQTDDDLHLSALQLAAANGKLDACKMLVQRGAEVYPNPMNQYPPVVQAAWNQHPDVVTYFLEEIPHLADGTQRLGVAINLAGRQGWTEIVKQHIQRDPLSVHARGWIGDSPLHWPAHNGFADIVTLLLEAGADVEADEVNWIGGKPLHWASEHAPASVKLLLEAGADVNSRNIRPGSDFEQFTPLIMNATQRDDCSEVTELLLEAGADINAKDKIGWTALQHAEHRQLKKIPQVLRAAGA